MIYKTLNKKHTLLDNIQDLSEIVKIISFQTDYKTEEIAKAIHYTRSHFSRLLGGKGSEKVIQSAKDALKARFSEELTQFVLKYSFKGVIGEQQPITLEQFKKLLQDKVTSNLNELSKDVHSIYNQQIFARAEVRAWGEYQIMKDAKNDENKRRALMEVVNKLIGENLQVDEKAGTVVLSSGN